LAVVNWALVVFFDASYRHLGNPSLEDFSPIRLACRAESTGGGATIELCSIVGAGIQALARGCMIDD
jgi:hypothetical protein